MTIDISISSEYVYRNYILHTYVYCLLHICESNLVVVKVEILLVRIRVLVVISLKCQEKGTGGNKNDTRN